MVKHFEESFFDIPEKPKKQTRPKRATKPKTETVAEPTQIVQPAKEPVVFKARGPVRDYALEESMRLLEPLMHPDSKLEHADILDPYHNRPDLAQRVRTWRMRNGK